VSHVEGFCEHSNKTSASIKGTEFDQLNDNQHLKDCSMLLEPHPIIIYVIKADLRSFIVKCFSPSSFLSKALISNQYMQGHD
jgi:hypothetical protein